MSEPVNIYTEVYKRILEGEMIKDSSFAGQMFTVIMFVGIITHLVFSNFYSTHGTYGPASALIWGYSIIVFSICAILFFENVVSLTNNDSGNFPLEVLLLIVIMLWLISINVRHFTRLNTNKVPPMYNTYSMFTTLLIALQLFLFVIKRVMSSNNTTIAILNQFNLAYLFILALIFILVIVQQIILNNFSVDVL